MYSSGQKISFPKLVLDFFNSQNSRTSYPGKVSGGLPGPPISKKERRSKFQLISNVDISMVFLKPSIESPIIQTNTNMLPRRHPEIKKRTAHLQHNNNRNNKLCRCCCCRCCDVTYLHSGWKKVLTLSQ